MRRKLTLVLLLGVVATQLQAKTSEPVHYEGLESQIQMYKDAGQPVPADLWDKYQTAYGLNDGAVKHESSGRAVGDDCSDPIVVTLGAGNLPWSDNSQTTCGRVNSYSETCLNYYDGGEDIVYQLILTEDLTLNFDMSTTTTYTGMLIADDCPDVGSCIDYGTNSSSGGVQLLNVAMTSGTYYLMIDTWPSPDCIPDFDLTISAGTVPPPPEPGDDCSDPIVINLPADLPYLDADQTTCGRGNAYDNTCLGSYDGGEDIIYQLVVTEEVTLDFDLTTTTTWTGLLIDDDCPEDASCIAYHTASSGGNYLHGVVLSSGTYYLMADTYPTPDCIPDFDLSIDVPAPPAEGDACSNPYLITLPYSGTGTTTDNTDQGGNASNDEWYQFTPAASGHYLMTLCDAATDFDTYMRLFDSTCDQITSNDDGPVCDVDSAPYEPSEIIADLVAGETYTVCVEGFGSGYDGNYGLTIETFNATYTVPGDFADIQSAVDATYDGDTIQIAAGNYEEQVYVTTPNLTIVGAGVGSTIIEAPVDMPLFFATASDNYPVLFVDQVDGVSVSNLTVDGLGRGQNNYRFVGIGYFKCGGSLSDIHVTGIRDAVLDGTSAFGIYFSNNGIAPVTCDLTDVTIDDVAKSSLFLWGDAGINATLTRVACYGAGGIDVIGQNGFDIANGTNATLIDCIANDYNYTPANYTACGYLFRTGTFTMTGCSADACQTSVYGQDTPTGTFVDGTITNPVMDAIIAYSGGATRQDVNGKPIPMHSGGDETAGSGSRVAVDFTLTGSTLIGAGVPDSYGVSAYGNGPVNLTMTNCLVSNWDLGVLAYDFGGATITSNASNNNISGNISAGYYSNTGLQNAEYNWWGDASGPYHATANPTGTGNEVSDYVDFDPWYLTSGYQVNQTPDYTHISVEDFDLQTPPHNPAQDSVNVEFSVAMATPSDPFRSLTAFIAYDPLVLTPIHVTNLLTPGNETLQSNIGQAPNGMLEVTWALLGTTSGMYGDQTLFSVTFDGITEDVNPGTMIYLDNVVMRSPQNAPIDAGPGAELYINVDDTRPELAVTPPAASCINSDPEFAFVATDNVDLHRVEYSLDEIDWYDVEAADIPGNSWTGNWSLDVSGLSDGDYTVYFRCWDDVGYVDDDNNFWDFHLDTQSPSVPANLTAAPRCGAVHLEWDAVTGNDSFELWREKRVDYPYFFDYGVGGGLPGESTTFTTMISIPSGATSYDDDNLGTWDETDPADRGVYDYKLVAVDCVNPSAESDVASATNYFLGDWYHPYDCNIGGADLGTLALYYGTESAENVSDELDVAPTSDWGRFGLPGPDGLINFEDLIVLAMNWRSSGPPTPFDVIWPGLEKDHPATASECGVVVSGENKSLELEITGEPFGVSVELVTDAVLTQATAEGALVLFYRGEQGWVIDAVGEGDALYEGSVINLVFATDVADAQVSSVTARDLMNRDVNVAVTHSNELPSQFSLEQNYPNPFNPTTEIHYALPQDANVRLVVYNVNGQVVRTLVNEAKTAGYYQLTFDGHNLASGVYYYRLQAGDDVAMKKMLLVK